MNSDEVVGPDVVAMLGPQPDARSVRQPEPSAFGLLPGDLQPLASPNSLDPLVVDEPACSAQQLGDLAVAVASVLPSKLDDVGAEPLLVVSTTGDPEHAGQLPHIIASVVGHEHQGETLGTYWQGASLDALRECVEAVRLPKPQPLKRKAATPETESCAA